ncbi:Hypothetical protein CINCED_3A016711 [Cinara cedri]|uniref:Uncharacterized protein n=1 Tax=Cinara cedri TaxID=506608 RepID=A0A5E4MYP8_9HEMI|nr:Hypothetical protein CINCED_3A016711 [Cinara cedri]
MDKDSSVSAASRRMAININQIDHVLVDTGFRYSNHTQTKKEGTDRTRTPRFNLETIKGKEDRDNFVQEVKKELLVRRVGHDIDN